MALGQASSKIGGRGKWWQHACFMPWSQCRLAAFVKQKVGGKNMSYRK